MKRTTITVALLGALALPAGAGAAPVSGARQAVNHYWQGRPAHRILWCRPGRAGTVCLLRTALAGGPEITGYADELLQVRRRDGRVTVSNVGVTIHATITPRTLRPDPAPVLRPDPAPAARARCHNGAVRHHRRCRRSSATR